MRIVLTLFSGLTMVVAPAMATEERYTFSMANLTCSHNPKYVQEVLCGVEQSNGTKIGFFSVHLLDKVAIAKAIVSKNMNKILAAANVRSFSRRCCFPLGTRICVVKNTKHSWAYAMWPLICANMLTAAALHCWSIYWWKMARIIYSNVRIGSVFVQFSFNRVCCLICYSYFSFVAGLVLYESRFGRFDIPTNVPSRQLSI